MNNDSLAYALDFTSFLILKLVEDIGKVKSIILFGSVTRGEAGRESDVDVFINVFGDEKEISKKVDIIKEEFYRSVKFTKFWKLLGIDNEIKPVVGKLAEWKDLKVSIAANGIILYGRYEETSKKLKKKIILIWENIKPAETRVMINKHIFGYSYYGKKYEGLLQKYQGSKLGKGAVEISIESYPVFMKVFKRYKVPVKIKYAVM